MVSSVKLADLWQRRGHRVVVLCMGHGERAEKISDTLEIHRVPDLFLKDPWNYGIAFGFSGRALKLARTLKPDVIVVNKILFWSSIALLRLRLAGFRVLLLTDALVGITWWPRGKVAQICSAIYAWTLGWMILKSATKVVFFHPQPEATLKTLGIREKSTVIPTGIDISGQRSAISGQGGGVNVTYVGRLESVKGVDDFVAAALMIKKELPELRIRVVGWYREGHELVRAHKHDIDFTGLRNDVPVVLSETDIFVLPSYSEGLSNALMEAMRAGCACIASDVGGNRYLIENGVSGLLFPAGDRAALAAHIRRLATDDSKRKALGAAAEARIRSHFSWDTVGEMYDELFRSWTT